MKTGIKTVGFLADNGKVYKRKSTADKSNATRERNKITNMALLKGYKVSKLK